MSPFLSRERDFPTIQNKTRPYIPNIDVISGALITLSLTILMLNSQCEEGARDGIDIWYMGIIVPELTL